MNHIKKFNCIYRTRKYILSPITEKANCKIGFFPFLMFMKKRRTVENNESGAYFLLSQDFPSQIEESLHGSSDALIPVMEQLDTVGEFQTGMVLSAVP